MKRLLLASILAAALASGPAFTAETVQRAMTVSGEASVDVRPDMAVIMAGVVAQGETAKAALDANATSTRAVIATFKDEQIDAKDIETSGFSLQPVYVYPQQGDGQQQPPRISGYSVSNTVSVKIRDLESLGVVLDKAVAAGANTINGIEFIVSGQSAALDEARAQAVTEARRKAEFYAKAAGVKLGRVLAISEATGASPPVMPMLKSARAMDASTPIEPGEQRLDAQVSVTFELVD